MSQHEEIEGWLERSGQVLAENAQAMRLAAAEALLGRAFGMTDRLVEVRRATDAGIVDEVSPEAMARVMASMREEFASASIAPVPPRPTVTLDDMVRAQRRRQRQDRAERRSMFEQLCEQWRLEWVATAMRRPGEPTEATNRGA